MTLLSNEENKEISLSSELAQASTEKVRWSVCWQSLYERFAEHFYFDRRPTELLLIESFVLKGAASTLLWLRYQK